MNKTKLDEEQNQEKEVTSYNEDSDNNDEMSDSISNRVRLRRTNRKRANYFSDLGRKRRSRKSLNAISSEDSDSNINDTSMDELMKFVNNMTVQQKDFKQKMEQRNDYIKEFMEYICKCTEVYKRIKSLIGKCHILFEVIKYILFSFIPFIYIYIMY